MSGRRTFAQSICGKPVELTSSERYADNTKQFKKSLDKVFTQGVKISHRLTTPMATVSLSTCGHPDQSNLLPDLLSYYNTC